MAGLDMGTGPVPAELQAINAQLEAAHNLLHGKPAGGSNFPGTRSDMTPRPTHNMEAIRAQLETLRAAIDTYLQGSTSR